MWQTDDGDATHTMGYCVQWVVPKPAEALEWSSICRSMSQYCKHLTEIRAPKGTHTLCNTQLARVRCVWGGVGGVQGRVGEVTTGSR